MKSEPDRAGHAGGASDHPASHAHPASRAGQVHGDRAVSPARLVDDAHPASPTRPVDDVAGSPRGSGPARRGVLGGLAGLGTAAALTACQGSPAPASPSEPGRQPGVTDRQPPRALLLSYDLSPRTRGPAGREAVLRMFAAWTPLLTARDGPTVTVGLGPALFARLVVRAPEALRDLPAFAGDRLRPEAGGGQVFLQVCAATPTACADLARRLEQAVPGVLRPRWRQAGFLPAAPPGETPRNLLGFKDGTANPTAKQAERWVWLGPGPHRNATYLVVRRIRLATARFGSLPVERQERVMGRRKAHGGPLQGGSEHTEPDFLAKTPQGGYLLPADAHVRLAHPRFDGGARILRRGYSYDNTPDDQGLLFLAYMNDPGLFTRVQRRLAGQDALGPFIEHYGSAVFFVPPAAGPEGPLGSGVL
ncbi:MULTISPECIES: Dyp-type peroxidase [unclassified Streptomyces]|uniref:Dyp-type peroxidase n=1 Tax=unclassified Streptomyces TaxID=2593676 RepID=UPI0033D444EB